MPYVQVPKDLAKIKTKVAFNLTKRQLICFGIAGVTALPTYFLTREAMLVVQDCVWNRVTVNRAEHKSTRYYIDEFHLLLKEEQTAA